MGKYDAVLRDLQKLPPEPEEAEELDRVKIAAAEFKNPTLGTVSVEYRRLRKVEDRIEAMAKKLRFRLRVQEYLLENLLEAKGLKMFRFHEGGSVAVQPEPYAQIQNKEVYHQWCIDEGLLPLMHLSWQTTNSTAKERLLAGQPPQPGVKVYSKNKFVLRKP